MNKYQKKVYMNLLINTDIMRIHDYKFKLNPGSWENFGGIELTLMKDDKDIMKVGGKIHEYTEVISIQGKKEGKEEIQYFKELLGIHPAKLNLLLFLKLGQELNHEKVTIRGEPSRKFSRGSNILISNSGYGIYKSPLYQIPRNYFRLKINEENKLYEFDGNERDKILSKFTKVEIVRKNI